MDEETKKKAFLMEQFFIASWSAAVRHNKFWDGEIEKDDKNNFVTAVWKKVKSIIQSYEALEIIPSEQHQNNIDDLKELKPARGAKLGIAKSQKILNLMCKYCWCMGWIPESPHLVIDRQTISWLSSEHTNLKKIAWTKMNENDYSNLLEAFNTESGGSPANWELKKWKSTLND